MTLLYEMVQIQGASKNKAETYLVYVEHLFLRSNAVDAPYISKGLGVPRHIQIHRIHRARQIFVVQTREHFISTAVGEDEH